MDLSENWREIEEMAKGLSLVKQIVDKQRRRERENGGKEEEKRREEKNISFDTNFRVFNDLSLNLNFDFDFDFKTIENKYKFTRKVTKVNDVTSGEGYDVIDGPNWIRPISGFRFDTNCALNKSGNGNECKKIEKKRFLTVLPKNEPKVDSKSKQEMNFISDQQMTGSDDKRNKLRNYDVIAVRKWMCDRKRKGRLEREEKERELESRGSGSGSERRRRSGKSFISYPLIISSSTSWPQKKKISNEKNNILEKVFVLEPEVIEPEMEVKEEFVSSVEEPVVTSFGSSPQVEERLPEPEEDICAKVKELVDRAVRLPVPDWDSLCDRVYNNSSLKKNKVLEVFPKQQKKEVVPEGEEEVTGSDAKKEKSVSKRVSEIRKDLNLNSISSEVSLIGHKVSSHDLFRLTSDIDNDVMNDDNTSEDEIPELSEQCSVESTWNTTQPEVIADLDIDCLIHGYCRQLFECGCDEQRIRAEMTSFDHKFSSFRLFLFDFCKEIVLQTFDFTSGSQHFRFSLEVPLSLQKKVWPKSAHDLYALVSERAYDWLSVEPRRQPMRADVRKEGLMAFCRKSKARDFVDSVLFREMCAQDWRWTHFHSDQLKVKEKVIELILDQLVTESLHIWRQLSSHTS